MDKQVMPQQLRLLTLAWVIALCATLGALFIGEVMRQTPCILCWYQRIAMFPLALILGIACINADFQIWKYALPLALIGALIALWHSLLYAGIIPEPIVPCSRSGPSCTDKNMLLLGVIPLPYLSLLSFASLSALLITIARGKKS
jgi:disulfide bond formation protein DsbB